MSTRPGKRKAWKRLRAPPEDVLERKPVRGHVLRAASQPGVPVRAVNRDPPKPPMYEVREQDNPREVEEPELDYPIGTTGYGPIYGHLTSAGLHRPDNGLLRVEASKTGGQDRGSGRF